MVTRISYFLSVALLVCMATSTAFALAFPGAEGFGANVTGGRGGTVYHVTNLNDSGSGSLRDAVSASGRTVVFDVGGVINITSALVVANNTTIAGQTAPGGGIAVYGDAVSLSSRNNIIIRHITFRQGYSSGSGDKALNMTTSYNIICDHVSVAWGRWDTFGITSNGHDITLQNCILAEGIDPQQFGGLIDSADHITLARNLFINNNSRNPKGKGNLQYINNVIYNWGGNGYCGGHSSAPWYEDLINNYFIAGPSSSTGNTLAQATSTDMVYFSGNYLDNDRVDTGGDGRPEGRLAVESDWAPYSGSLPTFTTSAYNAPTVPVPVMSAANAFPYVMDRVGNWLHRDAADQRMVNDAKSIGTLGALVLNESDVGGQPAIAGGSAPTDSDLDGVPDFFETAVGTNPSVADNNSDINGDGYTNIENYLNWLGAPHAQVNTNSYVDVDLRQFTGSYALTAVYTVSGATSGTVTLLADGKTARFTPVTDYSGLAKFDFTVNDGRSAGDSVSMLVVGIAPPAQLSPDPMTWASVPAAAGVTSITMTATTASSSGGVDYYFTCTAGGGHNSGWQTGTTYVDSGLQPNTTYTYTVKARDRIALNETVPSTTQSATTPALPPVNPPSAWWRFDETSGLTAADSSGNGNTGALQGTVPPVWTAGKYNNGLTYSAATDGGVYVPSSSTIDFGDQDMSVSLWLNEPTTMAVGQEEILIKGTIAAPGSGKRYEFYRKNSGTADNFRFAIDDNVVKSEISLASSVVCTGNWVHVVAVRDTVNNQLKLYVNNVLKATIADGTGSISQTEPLYIGDAVMVGSIDDVRVYPYALTADQITAIYLNLDSGDDVAAPTPNPMTFATAPYAVDSTSIAMVATTASDVSGVQYYFTCTAGGGHSSAWQASTSYTDTGLTPSTSYTYTVTARDLSANQNQTAASAPASATTQVPPDTVPPTPDPMTFATAPYAVSSTSIAMVATTATDESDVEYLFTCTAGGGHSSAWQASTAYTDTGLTPGGTYTYTVTARDLSDNQNQTTASAPASATTPDTTPPTPNPMTFATAPYATGSTSIAMVATTATDASGVEYLFTCTAGGGHSSAWQASTSYTDTGLTPNTMYTYTVTARDLSANQNQTAASAPASATTQASTPTFVAAGAISSGTGTITPALPSGRATGDVLLLFVETANQASAISNQNGGTWTAVTNSPQGTGTAGGTSATRLTAFWSRYNGTQGAPTVSDSGDHQIARIVAFRGVISSGDPWDVTAGGIEATADTSGAIPGATTTVDNTLVVVAIATALPDSTSTTRFSAWTNANLTSVTERTDNSANAGNGGGLGIATGVKATAGAYGNTAVTLATSSVKGMMSIALKGN